MNGVTLALGILCAIFFLMFVVTLIALIIAIVFVMRYNAIVNAWEDNIDDTLDIVNGLYVTVSDVLARPLFSDSPEVRAVVADLQRVRDAALVMANLISMTERPRQLSPDSD